MHCVMVFVDCAAYESAYESRTSCTRTTCCTTRGGRRSFFRDVTSESACIDGVDTLAHVIRFWVREVLGFWIAAYVSACKSAYKSTLTNQERKFGQV